MTTPTKHEPANAFIRALVSGLAGLEKRQRRQLLMLQAFIDGSASHDRDVLVLAGYIAPAEVWEKFSDEWKVLFDNRPYLYRQRTEFKFSSIKFNSPKSIKWAEQFYRIIEKHVTAGISCSIFADGLSEMIDHCEWAPYVSGAENLKNPYFFAFKAIINVLSQHQHELGITEPVDFVFDNDTEKGKCLDGWDYWKENAKIVNPRQYALLGDTPAFRDSVEVRPLQGADMHAGFVRKWYQEHNNKHMPPLLPLPWKPKRNLISLAMGFDAQAIKDNLDTIFNKNLPRPAINRVRKSWQKYGV